MLTHPNGWGLLQQTILRTRLARAVPSANLGLAEGDDKVVFVKVSEESDNRVVFVSEAEAAVHFALHYTSSKSDARWLTVSLIVFIYIVGPLIIRVYVQPTLSLWFVTLEGLPLILLSVSPTLSLYQWKLQMTKRAFSRRGRGRRRTDIKDPRTQTKCLCASRRHFSYASCHEHH